VPAPIARASVFDSRPARALAQELLAMTPGTDQFALRLRAVMVALDADQARLDRAVEGIGKRPIRGGPARRASPSNDA
jgi:hypothetical protein